MTVTVEIELPKEAVEVIEMLDDAFGETREDKLRAFIQFGLFQIPQRCFAPPEELANASEDEVVEMMQGGMDPSTEAKFVGEDMNPLADGIGWLFDGSKPRKASIKSDVGPFAVTISANDEEGATIKVEPPRSVNTFDSDLHERAADMVMNVIDDRAGVRVSDVVGGTDHDYLILQLNCIARPSMVLPEGWSTVESD